MLPWENNHRCSVVCMNTHQKNVTNHELVAESVFFDPEFYKIQLRHKGISETLDGIEHYLSVGWLQGFDPSPLFSTNHYLWRNPDVLRAQLNPLVHYIRYGLKEGRRAWSSPQVMRFQGDLVNDPDLSFEISEENTASWPKLKPGDKVIIYSHSQGHLTFSQFKSLLAQAFRSMNIEVICANELDNILDASISMTIVLAPHDFFFLARAPDYKEKRFEKAIMVNTEQMPSRWFARIMPILYHAPMTLDTHLQTAASLKRLGINARFLPIGWVETEPMFQNLENWSDRSIDLLWIGSNSRRRHQWFVESEPRLKLHKSLIRLIGVVGPLTGLDPRAVLPEQYLQFSRQTKIQLNIHHFNMPYFEWQRMIHFGLMQQNCIVTEHTSRVPGLSPGEHYLEESKEHIPELVNWLLLSKEGQEKCCQVSQAGYLKAKADFILSDTLRHLFRVPSEVSQSQIEL
jgi:hypothetical protein